MGEIAEMMLNGILDSVTGEYLGEACGYPRSRIDGTYYSDCDKLKRRSRQSINDLCRAIGITNRIHQQETVSFFLQCLGLVRLPKMQTQIEMVYLYHKKEFKEFLKELHKEMTKI